MDCIFCKIINGNIPSYQIYEDKFIYMFLDINPKANGHTLIIPKVHYQDLNDIDINLLNHINDLAIKLYPIYLDSLKCDGLTLLQNNGLSQEVKHYHLHLIPNYKKEKKMKIKEVHNILKDNISKKLF